MTERIRGHESQIIKGALWLFALIVFFYLRWQPDPETILNIDEYIAPAVSDAMRRLGSLDPNWSNTDLPDFFRYDQYNFYVYMIAAHLAISTGNLFDFEPLQSARLLNIALQLATIPMLYLSIRTLTGSVICGFAGIFLFITLPTAVMDSAIVRPESLLYFTSAALLLVSTATMGKTKTLVLWGVIFAFGAAIKITFVTLAPLLAGAYILRFGFELKRAAMDAALTVLAFAIALFVLAPFMFINADVTLNGLAYLQNQYDGLHPPHSLKFGNAIHYFLHNLHFFVLVIPAIFVLGGIGLFYGTRTERIWIAALLSTFLILLLYFSTRTVFFERNYAHAIVPAIAAAAIGLFVLRRRVELPATLIVLACVLFVPVNMSVAVVQGIHQGADDLAQFQQARGLSDHVRISEEHSLSNQYLPECGLFVFADFNDDFSEIYTASAVAAGYAIDAVYLSRFRVLPTSTLHTDIDSGHIFISRPCE